MTRARRARTEPEATSGQVGGAPDKQTESREPTDEERHVYALLVERLTLCDADRAELKTRRGLFDVTIDTCRFKSGGIAARRALDALRGHVDDETLVSSGLYVRQEVGGETRPAEPNPALTSGGGLIPYFDDNGACLSVQRHKGRDGAGYWLAGKRVEIYLPQISVSDRKTLYLAEGPYKAAALAQLGYFAVAVPGITAFIGGNFPRLVQWIGRHGTPSVVVVFDSEDKRERIADPFRRHDTPFYAWQTAHLLTRENIPAKIATLPLDWDTDRRKVDPDSALASGRVRGDFDAVFQRAVMPTDYFRSPNAVLDDEARNVLAAKLVNALVGVGSRRYRLTLRNDEEHRAGRVTHEIQDAEGNVKTTAVAHAPLWIAGFAEGIETPRRYVRLAFVTYRDGRPELETRFVERGAALNARLLVELANFGVPVDSSGVAVAVSYLSALDAAISPYLPTERLSTRNGWHTLDGERVFVLGDDSLAREDVHVLARLHADGNEAGKVVSALTTAGTLDDWRDLARPVRSASNEARFVLAAAFAAPLLDVCGTRSFLTHIYGGTGVGKTAMLKLAASVFGDPDELVTTLWTTLVGIERKAAHFCDLPTVFDELQASTLTDEQRKTLAYLLAQGVGKVRGRRDGGLQETARWRTVALTSGEQPLTTADDLGGQGSRAIEVYITDREGARLPDDLAREVHQAVGTLHGHAGRVFLSRLLAEDADELRRQYRAAVAQIDEKVKLTRKSVLDALGVVWLADHLSSRWVFGEQGTDSLALVKSIAGAMDRSLDYGTRALDWVRSWVYEQANHFGKFQQNTTTDGTFYAAPERERFGVHCENGDLWILPTALQRALKDGRLDERRVLHDWNERGWIETNPNERDLKPKKRLPEPDGRTHPTRVVVMLAAALAGEG